MIRFNENAQWPVPRFRTSNHAVGPGDFRRTGPRASRAARMSSRSSSSTAHVADPLAARQRAPELHDPLCRAHVGRAGLRALERRVASPRGVVPVGPIEDRRRRRCLAAPPASAARTRGRRARRRSRRWPTTGHADRQRPHSMQSSNRSYASIPAGTLGRPGELARRDRWGVQRGTARRTTSCRRRGRSTTGKLAIGSTVTRPCSRSARRVTHASPSRPFTRTPQVPHDAWKHECRMASDGSRWTLIHRRASSTVLAGSTSASKMSNREGPPSRANRKTRKSRVIAPCAGVLRLVRAAGGRIERHHHAAK